MDRKVLVLPLRAARIPVGTTSYYNFAKDGGGELLLLGAGRRAPGGLTATRRQESSVDAPKGDR